MTIHAATISDSEMEIRRREWQARGAASDRRTARRMRRLMVAIFAALVGWLFVQLT